MFAILNHPAAIKAAHVCDVARTRRGDPTGTFDLVKRYKALSNARWRLMVKQLRMTLVQQDMLGLDPLKPTPLSLALAAMPKGNKILAYQNWVDNTLKAVVIETDSAYLDPLIDIAYRRGLSRAMRLSKSRTVPKDLGNSISAIQHLVFIELQGIAEAVSQQLVRLASSAMIDRRKPLDIFRLSMEVIEKVGVTRTGTLIETLTVKAFNTGTLDQFEVAGVAKVGVIPETIPVVRVKDARRKPSRSTVSRIRRRERRLEALEIVNVLTAGDDDVCPVCEDIADNNPYTINHARTIIPAHPRCRCAFVPAEDERFAEIEDE